MVRVAVFGILGLACWALGMPGEGGGDWRDDLLKREGIERSKEGLEALLKDGGGLPLEWGKIFDRLGADQFSERDRAQEELLRGGETTLKWLRQRKPSPDPEVQRRVGEIMGLLGTAYRKDRELALEHAARSLLAEGEERRDDTGGLFFEWFGEGQEKLGERYRLLVFEDSAKRGGSVTEGEVVFPGEGGRDGDQRLVLRSERWPGEKTFGDEFQVSAKLRGQVKGAGAWHLGITVGRVRALYHPGLQGGAFRFERIDSHQYLGRSGSVGFTPGEDAAQWMAVKVQRLPGNKVRLEVILEEGGKKEGRFETSVIVDADQIGELSEVSLDRSGRTGGSASFSDFMVKLAGK